MAKRIQMRKNRFLALQKMAEQKKNEMAAAQAAMNANNAVLNDVGPQDMQGIPKQTVSLHFWLESDEKHYVKFPPANHTCTLSHFLPFITKNEI